MLPLLEKLLWSSPTGSEIKKQAIKEAEARRTDLQREIKHHDTVRDNVISAKAAERVQLQPQLADLRAQQVELENQVRAMHHRVEVQLHGEQEDARRLHHQTTQPLKESLAEVEEVLRQLRTHG